MKAISTGAFLVPLTNQSGSPNNTLFILWKNPTDKPLTTYLLGERTQFPVTTTGVQKEIEPPHLFKVIVPAHSFKPLNAGNPAGFYIRFSFFGNIGRDELKNQLSVEVIAGTSAPGGVTLSVADPTVFFRHADMVEADIKPPSSLTPLPDDPLLNMFQE
ncbi:hypothetical protein ACFPA1_22090 [Neobacillus sp. GCM10023253]|uniref:hypothetical protein n=1 Tax=Neobacillus sp. GCM10023253 TaxID=3252644 RepID=UPI00361F5917